MTTDFTVDELVVHAGWLRRFAVALVRDEDAADDVVQDTLVAAWQHPPGRDRDARPWLAEVARNSATDTHRAAQRRLARERAAPPADAPSSPDVLLAELELHRAVAEEVSALEEPYRQTVMLRYYEALNAAQIAERLNVPAGTVRWRLKEGLDRVRRRLDERFGSRARWVAALGPLVGAAAKSTATGGGAVLAAGAIPASGAGLLWPTLVAMLMGGGVVAVWWLSVGRTEHTRITAPERGSTLPQSAAERTSRRPSTPQLSPSVAVTAPAPAGEPLAADSLLRQMLAALEANAYDDFLRHAGDVMKAALDKRELERIAGEVGLRLGRGFEPRSLGTLSQQGHVIHLWKLVMADNQEDLLVRIALAPDGQVAGFWIE